MRKFFSSGAAFFVVGLLCIVAGLLSKQSVVFICVGLVWIILGFIARNRRSQKAPPQNQSKE